MLNVRLYLEVLCVSDDVGGGIWDFEGEDESDRVHLENRNKLRSLVVDLTF